MTKTTSAKIATLALSFFMLTAFEARSHTAEAFEDSDTVFPDGQTKKKHARHQNKAESQSTGPQSRILSTDALTSGSSTDVLTTGSLT